MADNQEQIQRSHGVLLYLQKIISMDMVYSYPCEIKEVLSTYSILPATISASGDCKSLISESAV